MKDDDFCQMFLYSLINLICFLLNIVYLTSLYNVNSQTKLLGIEKDENNDSELDIYQNSFTATATLFAFNFLGFLGFMVVLLLLINKTKVNRTDTEVNNAPEIQMYKNNGDIRTDERIGNSENITNINYNYNKQNKEKYKKLFNWMLFFFLFSQFVFLIEIIVITVYHSKSSELESDSDFKDISSELNYFTKIYRDLIIVGYIFIAIFIIFDLYTVILIMRGGNRVDFEHNDMENLNEHKYCDCFSDCLTNCCEKMAVIFNKCERENEEEQKKLNKELEDLEKKYEELNNYSQNLKKLNEDISKNKTINSITADLEKLHLPKSEVEMKTQRIEINTKK